jgi:hypothetical protein
VRDRDRLEISGQPVRFDELVRQEQCKLLRVMSPDNSPHCPEVMCLLLCRWRWVSTAARCAVTSTSENGFRRLRWRLSRLR